MNTTERQDRLNEIRAEKQAAALAYAVKRFNLKSDEVVGYNGGCCYDKVWVTNRAAAEKIAAAVKGGEVNGGMLHGMALGGISPSSDGTFEVIC